MYNMVSCGKRLHKYENTIYKHDAAMSEQEGFEIWIYTLQAHSNSDIKVIKLRVFFTLYHSMMQRN